MIAAQMISVIVMTIVAAVLLVGVAVGLMKGKFQRPKYINDELIHVWNFRVKDTSKTPDRLGEYPDVTGRWEYWKTKEGIQMFYSGKDGKFLTFNEAFEIEKKLQLAQDTVTGIQK